MGVGSHQLRLVTPGSGINDRVCHGEFVEQAQISAEDGNILVENNYEVLQSHRVESIRCSFALPQEKSFTDFIEDNRWNQERLFALQVRRKKVLFVVGRQILKPA